MDNIETWRFFRRLPSSLGFVKNRKDALHLVMNEIGKSLDVMETYCEHSVQGPSPDNANIMEPSIYFSQSVPTMNESIQVSGTSIIVDSLERFKNINFTGLEYIDSVLLDIENDMVGLSLAFDYDTPIWYVSDNTPTVQMLNAYFEPSGTIIYNRIRQDYTTQGSDEYIKFQRETIGVDEYNIAYLEHEPTGEITIIDTVNLVNPDDMASDGIIVNPNDYSVYENKVTFALTRSDYNPATAQYDSNDNFLGYIYPSGYQPCQAWNSSFIVEYDYYVDGGVTYMTQPEEIQFIGKKTTFTPNVTIEKIL